MLDDSVDPKLQLSVWQQYSWPSALLESVQDTLQDFTTLFPFTSFYEMCIRQTSNNFIKQKLIVIYLQNMNQLNQLRMAFV